MGYLESRGEMRNALKVQSENLMEKDDFRGVGVDWRIILKRILNK